MTHYLIIVALSLQILKSVYSECANACNGHGKCTSYDMCICNRNWQANDCSERVCPFGLAHVDTPKGDLDMSGALTGPDNKIIDNSFTYPYGTTEQFPQMQDSDLNDLTDSAHDYMECSNKGKCNRDTGTCTCYDGYDGVSCLRASCPGYPNSCSGHGVCKSISQLAYSDNNNIYKLWDKDTTMGCECDKGYYGADCSLRYCKYGVDPLYLDDSSTIKYPIFDFAVLATADTSLTSGNVFDDGQYQSESGYWAIRYYDNFGEDWLTDPIIAGASCSDVISALENIPNNVIPSGSLSCTRIARTSATKELDTDQTEGQWNRGSDGWSGFESDYNTTSTMSNHKRHVYYKLALWETEYAYALGEINSRLALSTFKNSISDPASTLYLRGYIYRIKFFGNPGAIKQPEIEIYLDGKRPSLVAVEGSTSHKVITKVWTDGQQGEYNDYFSDHCDNVQVTIYHKGDTTSTTTLGMGLSMLNSLSTAEVKLLKACLGDSDFDSTNNVELYDWDRGSMNYPHIIKLVRTVTTYTDGGYYSVLYADTTCGTNAGTGGSDGTSCSTTNPTFRLLNSFIPPDELSTDQFEIYTTKGTLALTSNYSEARFGFASKNIFIANRTYDRMSSGLHFEGYDGDISCEKYSDSEYVNHCLNKSDIFTLLNWNNPQYNPQHINLYTAERLYTRPFEWNSTDVYGRLYSAQADKPNHDLHFMTHYITSDMSTNWGVGSEFGGPFYVYKFFPSSSSTYEYVAECSNRGICNTESGLCECFTGYTSDSCHEQSSISL